MSAVPVAFTSPTPMVVAAALAVAAGVVASVRRPGLSAGTLGLFTAAALLLTVAAGEPAWDRPAAGRVAVMVDLSASTRGASFRDRAALDRRVAGLLGRTPYDLLAFAGGPPVPLPPGATLPDLPSDRTTFAPPANAAAVVLFSDGRFPLPATGPATYPVSDPALDHPTDAAVADLTIDNREAVAAVHLTGPPRELRWAAGIDVPVETSRTLTTSAPATGTVTATLNAGDRWPENDALTVAAPPPLTAEHWWVGTTPPPSAEWTVIAPAALPSDPLAYLAPDVIALANVPADALPPDAGRRLARYVRDLGGGLVIAGGDRAFAAGDYGPTPLEPLSPLASDPPTPAGRWLLLVDGSGSMAVADAPGPTPWAVEAAAVAAALPQLPPADTVDVGSFAAGVTWWVRGANPAAAAATRLPPASASPHGTTDLRAALTAVAAPSDVPGQALLMTDAEADPPDVPATVAALSAAHVRLNVLAVGDGAALPALRLIAADTGGVVVRQLDARQWVAAARELARGARPRRYHREPLAGRDADGRPLPVPGWNQTWLKPAATGVAAAGPTPLLARWNVGLGRVAAAAFPADPATVAALARQVAAPPTDPRYTVQFRPGSALHVTVDAVDGDNYLNGKAPRLTVEPTDGSRSTTADVPQVGSGLYELDAPAPRTPAVATVTVDGRRVGRAAVAGRYPPEFDAVGNDPAALAELAARTGGAVVPPGPPRPIDFHWPERLTPLTPWLATAAFVAVSAALVRWRRTGH